MAEAVITEAGPIQKEVQPVIIETAANLLTPKLTIIGKTDAIINKPIPAAEGTQIKMS